MWFKILTEEANHVMLPRPDIEEVGAEIAGQFRFLRFKPALEAQFERDVADERCRSLKTLNIVGLIIYHGFLASDYALVRDVFTLDLAMHFAVMTPVVVPANAVIARRPPPWVREASVTLAVLVLAATISTVAVASRMPLRDMVQFDTVLVLLFTTSVQRLRFRHAVATCCGVLGIYAWGLYNLHLADSDRIGALLSSFIGVLLFSLIACYGLEHEMRGGYLLRRRDLLRNRDLEAATLLDALTTIGNRRALDAALDAIQNEPGAGAAASTAVMLLDIDHFKMFNDTNGHQEGDACLKRVALIAAGAVSARGSVYRYGGEEFVVVLRDCAMDEAVAVAEAVRQAVVDAALPRRPDGDAVVTVSVGVAVGEIGRALAAASVVAEADSALYAAKRNGRNRVWPPVPPSAEAPRPERIALPLAC